MCSLFLDNHSCLLTGPSLPPARVICIKYQRHLWTGQTEAYQPCCPLLEASTTCLSHSTLQRESQLSRRSPGLKPHDPASSAGQASSRQPTQGLVKGCSAHVVPGQTVRSCLLWRGRWDFTKCSEAKCQSVIEKARQNLRGENKRAHGPGGRRGCQGCAKVLLRFGCGPRAFP